MTCYYTKTITHNNPQQAVSAGFSGFLYKFLIIAGVISVSVQGWVTVLFALGVWQM